MNKQPVRWWPLMVIATLWAVAITVIWAWPEVQRQQRYERSAMTCAVAGALGFVWFLFFSQVAWRRKLAMVGAGIVLVVVFAATFRIRGVSGDLLPIFEPRWRTNPTFVETKRSESGGMTNAGVARVAGEFLQFYGPKRNATLEEPRLETDWVAHPPKLLWKQTVGAGWSGFAVKEGLAITQEQREGSEYVVCYDVLNGATVWVHADDVRYENPLAGEGPRATPTIDGERVYTFGATGTLNCLELRSGKVVWTKDAAKENEAGVPSWGFASSPLVVDGAVVVSVGGKNGSLVAYDAEDGRLQWAEGRGGAEYSSPVEATLVGTRQILNFNRSGISGHGLDGKVLWNHPWTGAHPKVSVPVVVSSNQFFASSGYGVGCELVTVEKSGETNWTAQREWKSMALKSKFGPIFVKGDYIYGLDDGILACVETKTGQRLWKDGRYGHGQGLLVGEIILITSEKGEVVLVQPNPEKLVEMGRFEVFSDKTWNPPALAGEYLLMRNDKEAACLQLATRPEQARKLALSFAK
jgi:outer membrane protein assembly factor BamB